MATPTIDLSAPKLYMAPLQGFTDSTFRAAFCAHFDAPDAALSPFIETHKPEARMYRDVLPEKNTGYRLVPQLLGNRIDEMLPVAAHLQELGYQEVNVNLGCPAPMVTRRKMGSGLLPYPVEIDKILEALCAMPNMQFSVKMRIGMESKEDIKALIPILNRYPLSEVIIHARTGSQMYKGDVDRKVFMETASQLTHPVCYNGDLVSLEQFQSIASEMPSVKRFMFGRGLIANPLLLKEIRTNVKSSQEEIITALRLLYNQLVSENSIRLSGTSHQLNKLRPYWAYFANSLAGREKELKKIKKAASYEAFLAASNEALRK